MSQVKMRAQLVVFSICFLSVLCIDTEVFYDNYTRFNETGDTFSKYYLSNGKSVSLYETNNTVYFPKCCPPGYVYHSLHYKCVQNRYFTPIYDSLDFQVNLIGSGLSDCEVIVDSNWITLDEIYFLNTTLVFRGSERFKFGKYCFDKEATTDHIVLRSCHQKDYCTSPDLHNKKCLKKCCREGFYFEDNRCQLNPTYGIDLSNDADVINVNDEYAIWHEDHKCPRYKASKQKFRYSIERNGHFFVSEFGDLKEYKIDEPMYCIETQETSNITELIFLLCALSNYDDVQFLITRPTMIISLIFLLLTVVIYYLKSNFTLINKVIISYCSAMFCAYLFLVLVQFAIELGSCKFMGFATLFFFTAAFTWMNVLSFHIWKTFGLRGYSEKIFLKYNLYAWGFPIILMILVLIVNLSSPLPEHLHPFLGETQCVLENRLSDSNYGHLIFFVIPSGASILFNIVLFIMCLHIIFKKPQDNLTISNRKALQIDRQQVFTGLKLFLIMGISWSFEIISSVVDFRTNNTLRVIGILGDTFNCLQGLFIFLVFHYNFIVHTARKYCRRNKRDNDGEHSVQQDLSNDERKEMTVYSSKASDT